jgi:putative flippase GtrA
MYGNYQPIIARCEELWQFRLLPPPLSEIEIMGRFLEFIVVGGIAASLNWGSRFIFSIWFEYGVAIVLAYIVGMVSGFILMRSFVFDGHSRRIESQVLLYVVVNMVALPQTLIISIGLARWVFPYFGFGSRLEGTAHLIGIAVPVVTSYFGHKLFTFK